MFGGMIRGPFLRHHVHGEIHSAGWVKLKHLSSFCR